MAERARIHYQPRLHSIQTSDYRGWSTDARLGGQELSLDLADSHGLRKWQRAVGIVTMGACGTPAASEEP